jgi:hypothetical protein
MWLEETIWFWAPLVGAAVIWIAARLAKLEREVRSLRLRVTQLEAVGGYRGNPVRTTDLTRRAA